MWCSQCQENTFEKCLFPDLLKIIHRPCCEQFHTGTTFLPTWKCSQQGLWIILCNRVVASGKRLLLSFSNVFFGGCEQLITSYKHSNWVTELTNNFPGGIVHVRFVHKLQKLRLNNTRLDEYPNMRWTTVVDFFLLFWLSAWKSLLGAAKTLGSSSSGVWVTAGQKKPV